MNIHLEINGQKTAVREGSTLMDAVRQAGAYVPHFCYHEKLSIAANCRMCMVDVEKMPKTVPACATPAVDGMVVHTDSERAKKAQHGVMEFLLINHPLDCPICDQGGECQLQDLAVGYGVSRSRYQEEKRVVFEKNLGPLIATDMTRCIHCTRCVRFGREVAGIMELGMVGRGEHSEIMPFIEHTVDTEISGNMIDLCPVGALTSKPFRYSARPWELTGKDAVATHDSWGSHLAIQTKNNVVKRALPARRDGIHEHWISDRDRFSYEGLAADRALAPMVCEPGGKTLKERPWKDAIAHAARRLQDIAEKHGGDKIGFFVSPRATAEEAWLTRRIADHLGCANIDSRLQQRHFDGADISGFGLPLASLKTVKNIVFIGAEPARELPLLAASLRSLAKKKNIFSIAARDISGQLPLKSQLVISPMQFSSALKKLLTFCDCALPEGYGDDSKNLFAGVPEDAGALLKPIAEALKQGEETVIWLGDSARSAADYGVISALARQLAAHLQCAVGTLADGGNGVGVRRAGALPPGGGMHTAAMLAAELRAVALLRCEKSDFAEAHRLKQTLLGAEFACAVSSYSGGMSNCLHALLPAAEFTETGGTYVNGDGQITAMQPVAALPGKAQPAWKILRLLGEYLGAPGFDFTDLASVSAALPLQDASGQTAPLPLRHPPAAEEGYCLYGGSPAYGGDALVRRAAALQKTRQGKAAQLAFLHPEDMRAAGFSDNDPVVICDSEGNEEETAIVSDAGLARGALRFYPTRLAAAHALTLRPVAARQTA